MENDVLAPQLHCIGIEYVTPSGETCTAESPKLKRGPWGTLPVIISHRIKLDAYVDSLVDGLQVANRDFYSRCSGSWYGRGPWNGVRWSPVCWRVRGRGVINVGAWVIIQTPDDTLLPKPRGVT